MFEMIDLPFVWAALIAVAVLMYVILDGFDLGVGILFPFMKREGDRDDMMNSVAPVWDGNETWLVLGGGGLLAVFPLAYAIIMPALYMPIILMLLGLIFRGVAFEFRWKTVRWKPVWDFAFAYGSLLAALMQGIALGALVQGIPVANRAYAGGWWDWLTPFSIITGVAVVLGYALLGATWLILKTEGRVQGRAYRWARTAGIGTLVSIAVVSLLTPGLNPIFAQRWFAMPQMLFAGVVPLLVIGCAYLLFDGLAKKKEAVPFLASLGLFVLCFAGIGVSFYPYMVPTSVTIWEAAGPDNSLAFLLVGTLVLLPCILAYTAYSYWIFRGKVHPSTSYHGH